MIANTGDILTTEHGLDDTTPRGALLISAAHPLADKWFTFIAMIGCLLLVPAVLGAMGLVRVKAARLGLLGGVLMITGYICYFAMLFQGYATIALAQHGAANTDNVAVQDLMMNQGFFIVVALTFVVGNLIGTFLLGLALFRARVVPRWAAALVLVWPVAHILGGPWGEVLGAAVEARRIGRGGPGRAPERRPFPRRAETHGREAPLPQRSTTLLLTGKDSCDERDRTGSASDDTHRGWCDPGLLRNRGDRQRGRRWDLTRARTGGQAAGHRGRPAWPGWSTTSRVGPVRPHEGFGCVGRRWRGRRPPTPTDSSGARDQGLRAGSLA